jgi:copper chaperone CopZ
MSCGHCLNAVRNALGKIPGVTIESVTMGRASVQYDPAASNEAQITAAVTAAGYRAHVVAA